MIGKEAAGACYDDWRVLQCKTREGKKAWMHSYRLFAKQLRRRRRLCAHSARGFLICILLKLEEFTYLRIDPISSRT